MDPLKPNSWQAVSPLTIVVDDEVTEETKTESVANVSSTTIPTTTSSADTVKKPRAKWRKPEDKPHHPRTGYNFFFQLERERMLSGIAHLPILPQDVISLPVGRSRVANTKCVSSFQDGSDQTIHPRALTGEKLGFADLARSVASKWKKLDREIKQLFEEKAERERMRYKNELEAWNAQQKSKKLHEESPNVSSSTQTPKISHLLPASQSTGFHASAPTNGTLTSPKMSSIDQQKSNYLHMNHESNQREFREFRQDGQDQCTRRTILLDKSASPGGTSWQHSPQRSNTESFGEIILRQLTQPKVISPSESRVQAASLNFYQGGSCELLAMNGVPFSKSDLSSKVNRFIEEVCTVSEDLHHLAKRNCLDQCLSQSLQEIEHQVESCIGEFRRLSSQVQQFFHSNQDVLNNEQYNSQHCPILQANHQVTRESIRNQYHQGLDIPSLLKELRDVRSLLDCSGCQLDDVMDCRSRIAAASFYDDRNTLRINSDSVVVQPSPRRVSNMNEPNQFVRNMNGNSRTTTNDASIFDTIDGCRSGVSRNGQVIQSGQRSNQHNAAGRDQDQQERRPGISVPHKLGVADNGYETVHRRHRHFVPRIKNGSIDGRYFSDDAMIDTSLDFRDDGSDCDLENMEYDNVFDLEPIFPSYQAK